MAESQGALLALRLQNQDLGYLYYFEGAMLSMTQTRVAFLSGCRIPSVVHGEPVDCIANSRLISQIVTPRYCEVLKKGVTPYDAVHSAHSLEAVQSFKAIAGRALEHLFDHLVEGEYAVVFGECPLIQLAASSCISGALPHVYRTVPEMAAIEFVRHDDGEIHFVDLLVQPGPASVEAIYSYANGGYS